MAALYALCGRRAHSVEAGDDDFSFAMPGFGRFRASVLHQRGTLAAVLRVIRFGLPDPRKLEIPDPVLATARLLKGLVLVTGAAGNGKSTTLACLIDAINHSREGHIITMEDPIEFIHSHDKSIVTQREIGTDCGSYVAALRSALRESPDVILLGEMRDAETIEVAMTAAETGQLVVQHPAHRGSGEHGGPHCGCVPRCTAAAGEIQLSMVLGGHQPAAGARGGRGQAAAFEVMIANPAIRNLIREAKTHQIDSAIQAGAAGHVHHGFQPAGAVPGRAHHRRHGAYLFGPL